MPLGRYKNPSIVVQDKLIEASKLLKRTKIKAVSFEQAVTKAGGGDFIYFDPPYYPLNNHKNFTTYTKDNFLEKEQIKLANVFKILDKKGCKLMLSNSDTDFIRELYDDFNIHVVKANRMINSDANKRGKINELIITNY